MSKDRSTKPAGGDKPGERNKTAPPPGQGTWQRMLAMRLGFIQDGSLDPPLAEQLRPLSTVELLRRAGCAADAKIRVGKEAALAAAVEACAARGPREERRVSGVVLPALLCEQLTTALAELQWPRQSQRPGLSSDHYLVLTNKKANGGYGTHHPHHRLRTLCEELIQFAEPHYVYTAIAVTKNFVGSPHIDACDRSYQVPTTWSGRPASHALHERGLKKKLITHAALRLQLAVSLGDFEGGELCVDEEGDGGIEAGDGGEARGAAPTPQHRVAVVETRNRVAKVDGRYVHWVRRFHGGDRYSLIFYNTAAEPPHPRGPAVQPLSRLTSTVSERGGEGAAKSGV